MKLHAIKKIKYLFLVFFIFTLSFEILGQDSNCIKTRCGTGTETQRRNFSDNSFEVICVGNRKLTSVKSPNKLLFIAEFATQLLNRNVTVDELKVNQELLNGLLNGRIETDKEIIVFTPVETIRETIIRENLEIFDLKSPENKFLWRRELDGFDDAWEKYLKERTGQNLNPIQTNFLLRIGEEYLLMESSREAIKVFETVVKFKPELAEAQLKLGQANELAGKTKNAIRNYEKIINLQNTDIRIRDIANERLNVLKPNP